MLRRYTAFLLALLMLLGSVPVQAFAQTTEPAEEIVLEEAEEIPDSVYFEEEVLEELEPEQTEPAEQA